MNLKFISKAFDLNTKEEYSETFCIKSENEVIIKVLKVFIQYNTFRKGIGEVVAAGKDYMKLIRKKVEFLLPTDLDILKEYEICDGKYCLVTSGKVLMQSALTSLMLLECIKKYNAKYLVHVSGCKEILKYLEYLCKDNRLDLVNISSPVNSGVLNMLKYDLLLVGDLKPDMVFEERTPKNSVVLQYSTSCIGRILHQGTYIKENVFDWLSKLTYFKRKRLVYYIEYQERMFLNTLPKVKFEDFLVGNFENLVELDVFELFSQDFTKSNRRLSIDTQRLSGSGMLSISCSLIENTVYDSKKSLNHIEELVDLDCLVSPRLNSVDEVILNEHDENCGLSDKVLVDHLKKMIDRYSDPRIMKVLKDLSVFFEVQTCERPVFIKLIEEDLSVYEGEMNEERQPDGFGSRHFIDGTVFRGFWKAGKASGKGIIACTDGMLYTGLWKKGVFNGYGSLVLPDKTYREGFFTNGEMNGFGVEVLNNGEKYHGNFLNDLRHDKGQLISVDGESLLVKYFQGTPVEQRKSLSGETGPGFEPEDSWKFGRVWLYGGKGSVECPLGLIGEDCDYGNEYCESDSNSSNSD